MKTWLKRTLVVVFGTTVLVGGLTACGTNHHRGGWAMNDADITKMRERFIDRAAKELQLDEAQKAKLGQVADAMKAQRDALRAGGSDPRAEMQALVAGTQFDRAKAQALVDAKTGAVRDKAPQLVGAMGDFYDSLKPEQQQKLRDLMARGGHRWGRG